MRVFRFPSKAMETESDLEGEVIAPEDENPAGARAGDGGRFPPFLAVSYRTCLLCSRSCAGPRLAWEAQGDLTKAKLPRFLLDRPQKAPMGRCPLCQAHLLSRHSCFRWLYQDSHDAAKSCAGSPRPHAAKLKQRPAAESFACLSRGYAALGQGLRGQSH